LGLAAADLQYDATVSLSMHTAGSFTHYTNKRTVYVHVIAIDASH